MSGCEGICGNHKKLGAGSASSRHARCTGVRANESSEAPCVTRVSTWNHNFKAILGNLRAVLREKLSKEMETGRFCALSEHVDVWLLASGRLIPKIEPKASLSGCRSTRPVKRRTVSSRCVEAVRRQRRKQREQTETPPRGPGGRAAPPGLGSAQGASLGEYQLRGELGSGFIMSLGRHGHNFGRPRPKTGQAWPN